MRDPNPSLTTVCAIALWSASFAMATWYAIVGTRGTGVFALLLAAGGGTLTIRRFLVTMADDFIDRERKAFHLGLEAQRIKPVD